MKWLCSVVFVICFYNLFSQCIEGNCWNGEGSFIYPSGAKYVGEYKDGKIHGKGALYFSNGDFYKGDWIDHYRTGNGEMAFKDGSRYSGDFQNNKFNGKGIYSYANGDIYEGEWLDNIAEGAGEYFFVNGDLYVGQFKKGMFHGFGTMLYDNGAIFEGQWAKNKKNGSGKMVGVNGKAISGKWENGIFQKNKESLPKVKENISTTQGSSSLKTQLRNCNRQECLNGQGEFTYRDGTKYVGEFRAGQPYGKGSVFYSNGDKYVGGWAKHAPNGKGIMYYRYGRTLGAEWSQGKVIKVLQSLQNIPDEVVHVSQSDEVKIWSVIVGVGRYDHMPSLKYTDDDAYQLYAFLKSPEGGAVKDNNIRVLIDEDAQRENILRTMKRIFLQADENDVIMFYFSGHGYDGSFIPNDYDGYNNLIKHSEIIEILNMSRAKHKLVFADACHSGSLDNNSSLATKGTFSKPLKDFYRAFDDSAGGLALLLSSKRDEFSLEDQGLRQGVFSHYLMRGLKGEANTNADGIVDITELYKYVSTKVYKYTNGFQSPNISGKYDAGMPVSMIY